MARATRLVSTHFLRDKYLKKAKFVGIAAAPVAIIAITLGVLAFLGMFSTRAHSISAGWCITFLGKLIIIIINLLSLSCYVLLYMHTLLPDRIHATNVKLRNKKKLEKEPGKIVIVQLFHLNFVRLLRKIVYLVIEY